MRRLKDRGVLREPVSDRLWASKRVVKRPYGVRKPKDHVVTQPGDLVQVDTLDVRPLPGKVLKHFTARDVICRQTNTLAARLTSAVFWV